jgi:glutamyl-tRNA reductase
VNTALALTSQDVFSGDTFAAQHLDIPLDLNALKMVGLSFRRAQIEQRERLAFDNASIPMVLKFLVKTPLISEAVLINTCNRVELYINGSSEQAVAFAESVFAEKWQAGANPSKQRDLKKNDLDELKSILDVHHGIDALRHLMHVASSLDSQIIGEAQILGQVKDAYLNACAIDSAGPLMHYVFQQVLKAAKRVRTKTAIAKHAVTLGSAAKELADRVFGPSKKLHVIVIGTGEMAENCAKHLLKKGHTLKVVSRSHDRAAALSKSLGAQALEPQHLNAELPNADLVIASTTTAEPILTQNQLLSAMKKRRYSPTLYIDLGMPRNIEPLKQSIEGAYLYNVDDLQGLVQQNTKYREREADIARQALNDEISDLTWRLEEQQATRLIVLLKMKAEQLVSQEVGKAKIMMGQHGNFDEVAIHNLLLSLCNKLLHQPIIQMKNSAKRGPQGKQELELAAQLFGLNK